VIAVRVGPEGKHKKFAVHKNLLRDSSPFFKAASSNDWLESETRLVTLPEGEPLAFKLYAQWLYTGRLHVEYNKGETEGANNKSWDALIDGYLLGEYLQDTMYRDQLVDAIVKR
ncbi:hypothetical protein K458DRAFT_252646, partial [Lentithecium fluviatile CBS 122367]